MNRRGLRPSGCNTAGWDVKSVLGWAAVAASIVFGVWIIFSETGRVLTGRWTYTEKVEIDRGTYFRLKIDYTYRGVAQKFDIVVGCGVLNIRYVDGSGTRTAGLVPNVYGQRMSDGKAVVVRPPDACRGDTTANGGVPENFLPVMIVYEDADTVAFGTAYLSDEAYDSPRSLMTFGKATIESATRAEFDAFRESGPPNVITRSRFWSTQSPEHVAKLGLQKLYPAFGWHCYTYERWKLTDVERDLLRPFWPADKPERWMFSDQAQQYSFGQAMYKLDLRNTTGLMRDDGRILSGVDLDELDLDFGAARRDGVRGIHSEFQFKARSFYPARTDMSEDKWPPTIEERMARLQTLDSINLINVEIANTENRGFAYCYQLEQPPLLHDPLGANAALRAKPGTVTIDGQPVVGAPGHWRPGMGGDLSQMFERDEYMLRFKEYYLETAGGDV